MIAPDLSLTASKIENASRLVSAAATNFEWASAAPLRATFWLCSWSSDHSAVSTINARNGVRYLARRLWFCRKVSPSTRQTGTVIKAVFQTHAGGESNAQDFK